MFDNFCKFFAIVVVRAKVESDSNSKGEEDHGN